VFTNLDRSVLSMWGDGTDVYLVGGGLGVTGKGALVLRYDGSSFTELPTGKNDSLWWVWGTPDGSDVWMVGENGLALRWNGTQFTTVDTAGTTATLYGVWGSSSSDVWMVGGSPGKGSTAPNDIVLHWDGTTLSTTAGPPAKGAAFFKVWGSGADDLWIVGEHGTMWRRMGGSWMDYSGQVGTPDSLFTVNGCSANEVYAVGGQHVYGFDGTTWKSLPAAVVPSSAVGVACGTDQVLVVGGGGLKLRFSRADATWHDETLSPVYDTDFHAAFIGADGNLWASGGNYNSPPAAGPRIGVVDYYGCPAPSGVIQ
jgi:hypothetical protein